MGFHMSTFMTEIIRAISDICIGNTNASAWNLSFDTVLPFKASTVFGWFLDWGFQSNIGFTYAMCMILTTTHFVCFCYYIIAICNHFELMIDSMRFDCKEIQKEKNIHKHLEMWRSAREKLKQAIEMHANIHE